MWEIFVLFVIISLIIFGVFAETALSTRKIRELESNKINGLRKIFFFTLTGTLFLILALTIPRNPYPKTGEMPDSVIYVAARQFAFAFSRTPIANEKEWFRQISLPLPAIQAESIVEFRVTSLDVNHGFGLYDSNGNSIAQTQAMPGYVNRLFVHFTKPGNYSVLCLEYCGAGHHEMKAIIEVKP